MMGREGRKVRITLAIEWGDGDATRTCPEGGGRDREQGRSLPLLGSPPAFPSSPFRAWEREGGKRQSDFAKMQTRSSSMSLSVHQCLQSCIDRACPIHCE